MTTSEDGSDHAITPTQTRGEADFLIDFRALFEASPTPFLVVAPPGWIIVAANDARLEITGTTRDGQIGRPLFEIFPDDPNDARADGVSKLRASLERVLATRASDSMAVQRYAVRGPDGRFVERWWSPVNVPVFDSGGEVQFIIHRVEEVTDIVRLRGEAEARDQLIRDQEGLIARLRETEAALREGDRRMRLMVNELNHRVKNTLATVQSITAQTLRAHGDQGAAEAVAARLIALSRAHDLLTHHHWVGADLGDIVRATAAPHTADDSARVAISGPAVRVPPRLALALALSLHELATNAVKYGALSCVDGRVAVEWDVNGVGGRPLLDLTWRETGGPTVVVPKQRGLGTRLIERSLAAEPDGRAEITFATHGLQCRLVAAVVPDGAPNI